MNDPRFAVGDIVGVSGTDPHREWRVDEYSPSEGLLILSPVSGGPVAYVDEDDIAWTRWR